MAIIHHNQPIAIGNGITHIVGNHQSRQPVLLHDPLRRLQHLGCGFGIQGRSVLIQQQKLWLLNGSHQQRQCLTLATGEQADLGSQAILQA